ncbi:unnamed protein product [Paramecium primaurelia]|uniref:CHCH domain-containing protein n=2 Tax=Paramecium TaxID=5884 RepID=A0A8S1X0E0_9CILI|nr:unnamed protein product [Paramecium primaurelia]CAD8195613.1 unnamed protein product [Paramecium pentaurelia]
MESRSYNFSTAKKRSTQMESKVIFFPREDESAPRTIILKKECPGELSAFKECVIRTKDESKCMSFKDALLECGKPAFRKANTTPDYQF